MVVVVVLVLVHLKCVVHILVICQVQNITAIHVYISVLDIFIRTIIPFILISFSSVVLSSFSFSLADATKIQKICAMFVIVVID